MPADRAVGYFRVSSKPQEGGLSLDVQQQKYRTYLDRMRYRDAGVYTDVLSGTRADRHDYQRMLTALRAGGIAVCVVVYLDRFGRDVRETCSRVWELADLGVRVEATDESLGDGDDPLYMLLSSWKAERESRRIGERSRASKAAKLRAGAAWWHGRPPYGWRHVRMFDSGRVQSRLELDEAEAALVRQMVAWALDGLSARAITARLNEEGYRTRRGAYWRTNKVLDLLKRPHNGGTIVWGSEREQRRRARQHKRPTETITVADAIPPLLDPETAACLAACLERRRATPGRALGSPFLFSGLLVCGHCGHAMSGRHDRPPNVREHYRCNQHTMQKTCRTNYHNAQRLEAAVLEALAPAADAALARSLMPEPAAVRDAAGELAAARSTLATLERELLDNWAKHRRGVLSERQLALINTGLDARQQAQEERIAALERAVAETEQHRRRAAALPDQVATFLETQAAIPILARKAQLRQLVERITVWDDGRVEVRLRL